MELADADLPRAARARVLGPSLVLDLAWAVHGGTSAELRSSYPVLDSLYGERRELGGALPAFWADGLPSVPELQVLAHLGGALELVDLVPVREHLEATLSLLPPSLDDDLPLASETPGDRALILGRLADLAHSRARRRIYFELLSDVWAGVEPWWRSEGAPAVDAAAELLRGAIGRGTDWRRLAGSAGDQLDGRPAYGRELAPGSRAPGDRAPGDRAPGGREVVLAPCALFGRGLYLDLPGCSLIGVGATRSGPAARARTALVAGRLRALADPTRLAILDHVANGPSSVGEIARAFALAQPTVSAHVKQLRTAGLVSSERRGARVEVALDRTAVDGLTNELSSLLAR